MFEMSLWIQAECARSTVG